MLTPTRRYQPRHRRERPRGRRVALVATTSVVAVYVALPAQAEGPHVVDVTSAAARLPSTNVQALMDRETRVSRAAPRTEVERRVVLKAKPKPKPASAPQAVSPLGGYNLTSRFGDVSSLWSSGSHTGLDFAAPSGTPLVAIKGGVVTQAGWDGAYGYKVVVQLPTGEELWYCHLSTIAVSVGQTLATGETLGAVGATGNVTGAHLHLEYRPSPDSPADPAAALASWGVPGF